MFSAEPRWYTLAVADVMRISLFGHAPWDHGFIVFHSKVDFNDFLAINGGSGIIFTARGAMQVKACVPEVSIRK